MTVSNRKSHTRFRLVLKSITLDDLERPKRTLAGKTFYGAQRKNLNEDRPILSAAKCKPMIPVSRNIRCMRIFARGGASNDSGVVVLTGYLLGNFRQDIWDRPI